jgi:hypothetical protein
MMMIVHRSYSPLFEVDSWFFFPHLSFLLFRICYVVPHPPGQFAWFWGSGIIFVKLEPQLSMGHKILYVCIHKSREICPMLSCGSSFTKIIPDPQNQAN